MQLPGSHHISETVQHRLDQQTANEVSGLILELPRDFYSLHWFTHQA